MQPFGDRGVRFWQGARLLLAPLLAMVMLTIGCGTAPRTVGPASDHASRRLQSVSTYNVGVGLDMASNQYFMFADLEAARQLPEASTSFLVALDYLDLWGPQASTSGRIDVQVVPPAGSQTPVSAGVDHFYGSYDWYAERDSANRDIAPETFEAIASRSAALAFPWNDAPHDVVALATENGTSTTGSAWGDVRLMLASLAAWARLQPETAWSGGPGGGGGSGGGTGGLAATITPATTLAISYNLSTGETSPIAPTTQLFDNPPPAGQIFVALESAEFEDGADMPATLSIRTYNADGSSATSTFAPRGLTAPGWRAFLNDGWPTLPPVVAQMGPAVDAKVASSPYAPFPILVRVALAPVGVTAENEVSAALVAEAGLRSPDHRQDIRVVEIANDAPLGANEVRPQAILAIAYTNGVPRGFPVNNATDLAQYRTDPRYAVQSIEALTLDASGVGRVARIQLDYSGETRTFKVDVPGDFPWSDPGPSYVMAQEEWDHITSGEFSIESGGYTIQVSPLGFAIGAFLMAAAFIVGGLVLSNWLKRKPKRHRIWPPPTPEPNEYNDEYPVPKYRDPIERYKDLSTATPSTVPIPLDLTNGHKIILIQVGPTSTNEIVHGGPYYLNSDQQYWGAPSAPFPYALVRLHPNGGVDSVGLPGESFTQAFVEMLPGPSPSPSP